MDVIKTFNQELSSLYDTKPPISKAKITAITRSAIRAIKFYKHVVQSVEKFIIKCKPEYKVPALYVIDSLVRQSRHQFQDKDVFGPRFARNLKATFQHLYQCPPEDKSKIIRVLNLWQKNEVFTPDIIHPLFDMADPNHPIHRELAEIQARNGVENSKGGIKPSPGSASKHSSDAHNSSSSGKPANQNDLLQQLQHLQSLLQNHGNEKDSKVKFDKKLLDFDYGEEENDEEKNQTAADALGSILNNPEVLRQLQTLQNQTQTQFQKIDFDSLQREREKKEQELAMQEKEFDKHLAATLPKLPFASVCEFKPDDVTSSNSSFQHYNLQSTSAFPNMDMSVPPPGYPKKEQTDYDERVPPFVQTQPSSSVPAPQPVVIDLDKIDSSSDSNDKSYRKRSHRSRSTSRSRRHRSRSDSRSRSSRRRRSRSYDRDREEKVERYFDKEKEAERRKKSLPPFKKNHLAVCSTTLWIGHLSKLVQEEELSDTFGEYGDVVSINLIPPRGCAFVCMNRRQDAAKALYKLKNTKLQGKTITLAWAPGKGMKDKDWKDFWEVQDGVSYIPYDRLSKEIDYDYLEDGGVFDEDTVPLWLKDHLKSIRKKQEDETQNDTETPTVSSTKGDVLPSVGGGEIPTGFIPLPDGPLPSSTEDKPAPSPVTSIAMPLAPVPAVSQASSTGPLPGLAGTHLLMPPFGLPRLLGPMGMAMGPTGLMPNVPLGVPPPGLYKVHQQLLNRMPPPANPFGQNLAGDFPEGMLPLPFGLQHLQPALQPGAVNQTNKEGVDKPAAESLLNVLGGPSGHPFPHLGGQFPPNLPLMSVPPPSIISPSPSAVSTIQNLSVPPPALVKKDEKHEEEDDDVVMEDTESTFPKKDERDGGKEKKEERDDRRGGYKDRERDRDNRDKYRENRDNRDRDGRDNRDNRDNRDRYRDRDKNDRDRDRNDREDRWGGRFNRGGRGGNSNNSSRSRGEDRNSRDSNSRSSRWNQDGNENHDEKNKPNNRNNNNNSDSNKSNKDEHMNHPPPNFIGPPPGNNLPPGPPGLMRPPPPHFMRPPGPPHMFGQRNNMDGFRPRFDSPNNRNQDNVEDFEGFPLEHRFPPGGPRRDFDEPNFRPPHDNFPPRGDNFPQRGDNFPQRGDNFPQRGDNFPPRGDNFPPRGDNFPPRGDNFPPRGDNFPPRGPPFMPPQGDNFGGFGPRGPGPMDNFGPRGPPPPFVRPDMHPDFHSSPGGPPRPLMGMRGPHGPDQRRNMDGPPAIEPFRARNPKAFGLRGAGPPPLGAIPRAFRFQGKGPSGDDFDNRPGRKNQWKDQQGDSDHNRNRQNDVEPRTKRSRWGENSEDSNEKDNPDKNDAPSNNADSNNSRDNEVQVSSVTNLSANQEPSSETQKQTVIPDETSVHPEAPITQESNNEIKPDSVKEAAFSNPEPVIQHPEPTSKHSEPTSKQEELPTQGPGDTSENFTKIEETKSSEEIVCDSTVD
ncbi:hypothetical protein M8J75_012856 [Diaphorina citri]|nr:hypothetical protein M8J75_012856 [Diaphorina citri]